MPMTVTPPMHSLRHYFSWSPSFAVTIAHPRTLVAAVGLWQRGIRAKPLDDRDGFGRRRLQAQCETMLPAGMGVSLPPLSYANNGV